jgi:DNA topoisomerase VI subunit B
VPLVCTSGTTSSRVAFIDNGTGLVKLQFVKVGARVRLLASERTTRVVGVPGNFGGLGFAAARVNWRLLED